MDPIRKQFPAADPVFPFDFSYRETKSAQRELPDHLHDWYELVCVHAGKGTFFIDDAFYDKRAGDWFAIPGNTIHRAIPHASDPYNSSAIFFSPLLVQQASFGEAFSYLRLFEQAKKQKAFRIGVAPAESLELERTIDAIRTEWTERAPGYRHAISLLLQSLLLRLVRGSVAADRSAAPDAASGPPWMGGVLRAIDERPEDDLTLSALARSAAVSPAHLSRAFKQMTGMNVTDYVTAKRVVRAKELLSSTDLKVGRIAAECGFESLPHFHRMFKKLAGMTPAAYKRARSGGFPAEPR